MSPRTNRTRPGKGVSASVAGGAVGLHEMERCFELHIPRCIGNVKSKDLRAVDKGATRDVVDGS